MNSLDTITLKAFVVSLLRLDNSLPVDLQNQLNQISNTFPREVSKLHAIAKSYAPLELESDTPLAKAEGILGSASLH